MLPQDIDNCQSCTVVGFRRLVSTRGSLHRQRSRSVASSKTHSIHSLNTSRRACHGTSQEFNRNRALLAWNVFPASTADCEQLSSTLSDLIRVAVNGHVKARVEGHLDVAVDADRRVEHASGEAGERDRTVVLAVEIEAEQASVEVEEDADDAAGADAAVCPVHVLTGVHKPAACVVDVHAPAAVIFTCRRARGQSDSTSSGS